MSVTWGQITLEPLWQDHGLPLAIMGMLVVFMALVLVSTFIVSLPKLMALLERVHAPPAKSHATKPTANSKPAALQTDDELPIEIQVVIAAAVAEVIGGPHRIVRTRRRRPEDQSWSLEGRMQHHTSHGGRGSR